MQARFYEFLQNNGQLELLICENDKEADELAQIAIFKSYDTFVLPDFRAQIGDDLKSFSKELFGICKVLNSYHKSKTKKILISPIKTILNKLPSKDNLKNLILEFGQKLDIKELKNTLINYTYELVDMVQDKGEFSYRGDIIDIFAINEEKPIRILLYGDEIESIRYFDLNTQKSFLQELENIEICPFLSVFSDEDMKNIQNKIQNLDENILFKDLSSLGFWCIDSFFDYLTLDYMAIKKFDELKDDKIIPEAKYYKNLISIYNKDFFSFHKNKNIILLANNEGLIKQNNIELNPNISYQKSDLRINIISNKELIISLNKKPKKQYHKKATLIIDELKNGDFITHQDYGIGQFIGLEMIKINGIKKEFVAILYQNNDKLLLPVENLYLIDKYLSVNSSIPYLDKLGKSNFLKIKERLKDKLFVIASKLIELAAKRALIEPKKIEVDFIKQANFVMNAGFEYTIDQQKVCDDILKDFCDNKIMDRLISADVGFGKTEVAMNAILPVVNSGFAVFFFVPTTLLSHQHFKTLSKRFAPFNIEVLKLDRFTNSKEKKQIHKYLQEGKNFILIGTHSLLSLQCNNLGLIIIDEEHKFGVKQKEKLKEFCQNSHIISMSATPIPRSLNQALSSIKSYSTIQTPPDDRLDVRTFVKYDDDILLKELIARELRRAGQVFFIHNHIATIDIIKSRLLELMPNLKILILHSKIDAKTTEEEMLKFENKEYDLLLSTSIVESGIDLPNVNTIVVQNANRFGMADLHQLRGRVGRSNKQGYCYFLIDEDEKISEEAKKRLISLESNSFLGAGSVLAYHDLEIRGGGNLLGIDQSGHIEQVGLSLYLKMLEDELNILSKKQISNDDKLDIRLNINAFLNSDLIAEDRLRLELYRRLSKCKYTNEVYEIQSEIEDRFGKLDKYTKQFLDLIIIKILANKNYKILSNFDQNIQLISKNDEKTILKANSKDDDDIISCIINFLKKNN